MATIKFLASVCGVRQAVRKYENTFVVVDSKVDTLYGDLYKGLPKYVVRGGENGKTLKTAENICRAMLAAGCNRHSTVAAIGGGVTGDIAGFAAAIYMRGVRWIVIPTTLLSQVDSAVGGKTAADLDDYKNIVGAFHNPREIHICPEFLNTLPAREWVCGMGEIIKTAFLDSDLYDIICSDISSLIARDEQTVRRDVELLALFKQKITRIDPCEKGVRKILNLGHTAGHAFEKVDGHKRSHGEYVMWGMLAEAYACRADARDYYSSARGLVSMMKLKPLAFDSGEVAGAALTDKKNNKGISVMYAERPGDVRERVFTLDEFRQAIEEWKTL